jgi:hypothetical protein
MTRQRRIASPIRSDIDDGGPALPPSPKRSNGHPLAPGYLWNSTTQELIPILPEDHPDYVENAETVKAAILRWDGKIHK